MVLELTGRISTRDMLLDTDLRDLGIIETADGPLLCATTGRSGGVSVYRIAADGQLASLADSAYFDVTGLGMGSFDIVETDGTARLVLHGIGSGALVGYAIEDDGSLSDSALTDLPGTGTQAPAAVAACSLSGGQSALYMVDAATGAIDAWVTDGKGRITAAATLSGKAAHYTLDPDAVLCVAQAGGRSFLLAADGGSHGVSCYGIDTDTGALARTDTLGAADGLGVALPTALQTITAHGATWVLLAASGSSSISVMELGADGSLTPTDHIIDTLATRFANITALEVVEADGHVFVLAGGADDGLSLFTLLPDGRLVHLQSLAHETGLGLENVTAIEALRTGDQLQIFVTSGTEGGLSQFALSLDSLGSVLDGSGAEDVSAGSGAGDVIIARDDKTVINGEAGDDILVSGTGGGVLTGGAGADTFVLSPTEGTLRILDFERGTDRLDLSSFPMLRSISQLKFEATSTGTWVRFGSTEIKVVSADGKPLGPADLWPGGFDTPDRIALPDSTTGGSDGSDEEDDTGTDPGTEPGDTDTGTPLPTASTGDDTLTGTAGRDVLSGLAGNDTLSGAAGRDRLKGGSGDDRLDGGAGRDMLKGGGGNDRLIGGTQNDQLQGQGGGDRLLGEAGKDTLKGGAGDDALMGGTGNDSLSGQGGNDRLIGEDGRDRLSGGAGDDRLDGGAGADRLLGGAGDDRLIGGTGNDRYVFEEDHGDDTISDFDLAGDQIELAIPGMSYTDLEIIALEGDTLIDTGEGTILLEGIDPDDLDPEHFLFT